MVSTTRLTVSKVVERRQTQVDVVSVPADVILVVSDVSDDEATGLAVVGQDATRAAPAKVVEVTGGRVVGVCKKGRSESKP